MKKCSKCLYEKPPSDFGLSKSTKDGLRYECKECRKKYNAENKMQKHIYNQKYWLDNKKDRIEINKKYRDEHKITINAQRKEYRNKPEIKVHIKQKNIKYQPIRNAQNKLKRKSDKNFQLKEILKSKIYKILKGQKTSFMKYLGCSVEYLKKWLEIRFTKDMSWDNFGSYWQIDHVIPIDAFTFGNEPEKYICFNWKNLQPLQSIENRRKTNKILLPYIMNNIICAHRFIQKFMTDNNNLEYQGLKETLNWLRVTNLGMVKISQINKTENPHPSS